LKNESFYKLEGEKKDLSQGGLITLKGKRKTWANGALDDFGWTLPRRNREGRASQKEGGRGLFSVNAGRCFRRKKLTSYSRGTINGRRGPSDWIDLLLWRGFVGTKYLKWHRNH